MYFLVQACGSLMVLIGGLSLENFEEWFKFILTSSLVLKVGAAPFHPWYVNIAEGVK